MTKPFDDNLSAFDVNGQSFALQRYPFDKRSQLRAWDAADSYLLDLLESLKDEVKRLCIVHDNFGALAVPLAHLKPVCYGDSWMSLEATRLNLKANYGDDDESALDFETDLESLIKRPESPDLVIGRVPKGKKQLAYLLSGLQQWVSPGCTLLLAGMDKHLSKGQYDLLDEYFGPASFLPGVKKARVWKSTVDKTLNVQKDWDSIKAGNSLALPGLPFELSALPNVFSNDHLDIGSRFFLEQFASLPSCGDVADLACGNGVLGLAYLQRFPSAKMHFFDESFQAVRSSQVNFDNIYPKAQAEFIVGDGLKQASDSSLDLVLCNPPFHQQNAVSTAIANGFFRDAKRALRKGGEIWIVANRHLGYHADMKRCFGNFENIAANKKFVVLKAVR